MEPKETKNEPADLSSRIKYMTSVLDKINAMSQNIDSQISILIGISSAIFLYSMTKMGGDQVAIFFTLGLFSGLSIITGLISVHPHEIMRARGKDHDIKNLSSNKAIASYKSASAYADALEEGAETQRKITEQYASAIFAVCVNYYRPKRDIFKFSTNLLMIGIILSSLISIYIVLTR